jgi:hypothetical protein
LALRASQLCPLTPGYRELTRASHFEPPKKPEIINLVSTDYLKHLLVLSMIGRKIVEKQNTFPLIKAKSLFPPLPLGHEEAVKSSGGGHQRQQIIVATIWRVRSNDIITKVKIITFSTTYKLKQSLDGASYFVCNKKKTLLHDDLGITNG